MSVNFALKYSTVFTRQSLLCEVAPEQVAYSGFVRKQYPVAAESIETEPKRKQVIPKLRK